jgi:hypothetical protein
VPQGLKAWQKRASNFVSCRARLGELLVVVMFVSDGALLPRVPLLT